MNQRYSNSFRYFLITEIIVITWLSRNNNFQAVAIVAKMLRKTMLETGNFFSFNYRNKFNLYKHYEKGTYSQTQVICSEIVYSKSLLTIKIQKRFGRYSIFFIML